LTPASRAIQTRAANLSLQHRNLVSIGLLAAARLRPPSPTPQPPPHTHTPHPTTTTTSALCYPAAMQFEAIAEVCPPTPIPAARCNCKWHVNPQLQHSHALNNTHAYMPGIMSQNLRTLGVADLPTSWVAAVWEGSFCDISGTHMPPKFSAQHPFRPRRLPWGIATLHHDLVPSFAAKQAILLLASYVCSP